MIRILIINSSNNINNNNNNNNSLQLEIFRIKIIFKLMINNFLNKNIYFKVLIVISYPHLKLKIFKIFKVKIIKFKVLKKRNK